MLQEQALELMAEALQASAVQDAKIATAQAQIAVDVRRWVDSQLAQGTANLELIQVQTELQKLALEQMKAAQAAAAAVVEPALPGLGG